MTRLGETMRLQVRTMAVLSLVLDLPILARLVRRVTPTPREESVEVGGVPVTIVRPGGDGPYPAIMFVTGAHPLRRKEPVVERVAHGLARAGYLVVLPDLPGLGLGELTCETVDAAVEIVNIAVERSDVRGGRVALIGASAGASIALLVAARPELAHRISGVSSVTPFADLRKMICLATTARYENTDGYREYGVTNLLRRAVARSMIATVPEEAERARLLTAIGDILEEDDPFARLPRAADQFGPDARAILRVLENRDTARFAELYDGLAPELRTVIAQLSPLSIAAEVRAPVELAVPPNDPYFPIDEAELLARSLPNVRLTVTSTLDHTRPMASLKHPDELHRFDRFVVRTLAAAAS
jgi:pimeloyl-ACP methyl ester carboxylesterase